MNKKNKLKTFIERILQNHSFCIVVWIMFHDFTAIVEQNFH